MLVKVLGDLCGRVYESKYTAPSPMKLVKYKTKNGAQILSTSNNLCKSVTEPSIQAIIVLLEKTTLLF